MTIDNTNQNNSFGWSLKKWVVVILSQLIVVYVVFYVGGILTPGRILAYALLAVGILWWVKGKQIDHDTESRH